MQSIESMIEVLEGFKAGKKIQYRWIGLGNDRYREWTDFNPSGGAKGIQPNWSFVNCEYRLKQELKTARVGVVVALYPEGNPYVFTEDEFDPKTTRAIGYKHVGYFFVSEGDKAL